MPAQKMMMMMVMNCFDFHRKNVYMLLQHLLLRVMMQILIGHDEYHDINQDTILSIYVVQVMRMILTSNVSARTVYIP
jgi:hypothetical protein